jgi:AraC-like DNA-binding protein
MEVPRTLRGDDEAGRWEMALGEPHTGLARDVPGYTGLRSHLAITTERHLPSGEAAILVNLGAPHTVASAFGPPLIVGQGAVAVMGVHDHPFRTVAGGAKELIVIRLQPTAARALLGAPMGELANRWLALKDIDPPLAAELLERIDAVSGWRERFEAAERVVGARLAAGRHRPETAVWAWETIRRRGGRLSITALARAAGVSHRRLIGQFADAVGQTPKTAARVARFNSVLRAMRRRKRAAGADMALEFGYADQAHMIAEFRAFAGATPGGVARRAAAFTLRD